MLVLVFSKNLIEPSNKFVVVGGDSTQKRRVELIEMQDSYPEKNFSGCHLAPIPEDGESKYHVQILLSSCFS